MATTIEQSNVWINVSKSGKALNVKFNDELYTVPIKRVKDLIAGNLKTKEGKPMTGITFSVIKGTNNEVDAPVSH